MSVTAVVAAMLAVVAAAPVGAEGPGIDPVVPEVVAGVVNLVEGDTGTTVAQVPVSLSEPTSVEVTVDWSTFDWTATAPDDYVAASGTVTFAADETDKTVEVTINGDELFEASETVAVLLSNPTNATIGGLLGLGAVNIFDDDPQPTITPGGFVAQPEGADGSSQVWQLSVTLSAPAGVPVTVDYATVDTHPNPKVAQAGSDFTATSGTLVFAPGETDKTVPIEILGDDVDEPALYYGEWGFVSFTDAVPATISGGFFGHGLFAIIDDDDPVVAPIEIEDFGPEATLIDFDDLADGDIVGSQYAGDGVIHDNALVVGPPNFAVSAPNVIECADLGRPIEITFPAGAFRVGATIDTDGFGGRQPLARIFDEQGTLLAAQNFGQGPDFVGFESTTPIATLVLTREIGSCSDAYDDLRFEFPPGP